MGKDIRTQESPVPQALRIFTDREEPRRAFWECYNKFSEDIGSEDPSKQKSRVLAYYGVGGIGKTSLLNQLMVEMEDAAVAQKIGRPLYVDFDLSIKQEPRAVMESIRNVLAEKYGFTFFLFDLGCFFYAKKIHENMDRPEIKSFIERSEVLKLALDSFGVVDTLAGMPIPVGNVVALVAKLADMGVKYFKNKKAADSKELRNIDALSHAELLEYLPLLLAHDISENMERIYKKGKGRKEPLVIFLDTYECLVNEMASIGDPMNNDKWLRNSRNGLIAETPYVLWVIGGREKLKWKEIANWNGSLEQHLLGDFSEVDARDFLRCSGIDDSELQKGLYRLTRGTPVYLDLCVRQYQEERLSQIEDFGRNVTELIERFARYMDDARKDIVYMLSCLGEWSEEMLDEVVEQALPSFSDSAYESVMGLSFIVESVEKHYIMHQTVRDVLYKKCPQRIKRKTTAAAIDYSEKKLKKLDAFSTDYEYYVGILLKQAIRFYTDDDDLSEFYTEHVRPYFVRLCDLNRFCSLESLFNLFWERASQNKDVQLYALAQKDYSIWLRGMGRYSESAKMSESAYKLYTKILGADNIKTLRAQREYAMGLHLLYQNKEALEIRKDVLKKRIKKLGENNCETIESYEDIEKSFIKLVDYKKQLKVDEKICQLYSANLDSSDPRIFFARNNVISAYRNLGMYQKANEVGRVLIADVEQTRGKNDIVTFEIIANHVNTLEKLGQYNEVVDLRKNVLERSWKNLGENHPTTLGAVYDLAKAYCEIQRPDMALPLWQDLLNKWKQNLGENHPCTLQAMWGVAYSLEQLNRYQEALNYRKEIYERYRETQGDSFSDTIGALGNIAGVYECLEQYDCALEIRKKALKQCEMTFDENSPPVILTIGNLADTYEKMGRYVDALPLYEIMLKKCRGCLGDNHPSTLAALCDVAGVLEQLNRYQEALNYRREIYEQYRETQGDDFSETISALNTLAWLYFLMGDPANGIPLAESVVNRIKGNKNVDVVDRIEYADTLTLLYASAGQLDKAYKWAQKLLKKSLEVKPDDMEFVADRHYTFAYVLNKMNRLNEALVYAQKSYDVRLQYLGEFNDDTKRTKDLLNEIKSKLGA